jgi:hypothetical protein
MSLVVAFSCLLFSRLGAANCRVGWGGGGDPRSLGSWGQHPCLLPNGAREQQALLRPLHDNRQHRPHAFASYAGKDDPGRPPPHRATTGHGGGHVLHSPRGYWWSLNTKYNHQLLHKFIWNESQTIVIGFGSNKFYEFWCSHLPCRNILFFTK